MRRDERPRLPLLNASWAAIGEVDRILMPEDEGQQARSGGKDGTRTVYTVFHTRSPSCILRGKNETTTDCFLCRPVTPHSQAAFDGEVDGHRSTNDGKETCER